MPSAAFASFSYRSFSYFWFGGLIANSARWFQYVALPAVIWELTHSPGWVGFAGFAQFLPMALIAPVSGMLADRFPRRNVLMLSQSLMGAVAVILALVWFQGVRSPAVYVVLAAMSGLTGGLNLPVWQAFVSELVPRELLLNAVTLNSAQFNSSRVVGPMLGGITVAAAGPGVAFMVSAGGSLIVLLALIRVQSRKAAVPGAVMDMRLVRSTLAVARYVRARNGLVVSFGAVALIGFFGLPIQVLTVVFAEDVFDRGPGGYGLMLTVIGVGAVATTPVIASMGGRVLRSRIQRIGLVVYGSSVLVLSVAPTFVLFLVPLVFVGAAHLASASALNTTVQLQVDEERRTQVLALYIMVLMTSNPLGQFTLGQLIELLGARPAFATYGAALLAGTAVLQSGGWLRHMDIETGEYSPEVAPEVHPTTPAPPRSHREASGRG